MSLGIGEVNGHIVGRVLKETVRRATVVIAKERTIFEATGKPGHSGSMDDVFTSADTKAQEIYLRTFNECFPNCGVIGEEDNLRIDPKNGCTSYFTVDPLDGTKAYIRRQSHGVATMVALVDKTEVISAYVGDVNTDEVYGYRPGSEKVFRITRQDAFEELLPGKKLEHQSEVHALLRDPLDIYRTNVQMEVRGFGSYEVMGSSIGTWFARIWKGEVSALVLPRGWQTPWDSAPVIGISEKLGYVFLQPATDGSLYWHKYIPVISKEKYMCHHDTLVVHSNNLRLFNVR